MKEDWNDLLPGIAPTRSVLVFDNRGMGQSSVPDGKYTMDEFVNDTNTLVKHVYPQHNKVHLMGISMGGMIVQCYITTHPSHVQSLIIGCSHSAARAAIMTPDKNGFVNAMSNTQPPKTKDDVIKIVTAVQRFQYTDDWIRQNPAKFQQAVTNSMKYKRSLRGQQGQFGAISKYDVRDKLSSINTPTLVIHGSGDQVIDCRNGEVLHQNIKDSELLVLKDVGHIFWNMDNGQAMKRINEFISKHDPKQSRL